MLNPYFLSLADLQLTSGASSMCLIMKQFSSETGCSKTFIQGLIILFFRPYWHAFHDMIIMMIGFKHFWIRLKYLILAFPNFELAGYVFCFWPNLARDMELFVR